MKAASNSVEPNWGSLTFKAGKKYHVKTFHSIPVQLKKSHAFSDLTN